MEIIFTYITNRRKAHMFALGWLLVQRCKFHLFIFENRAIFCNFLVTLHLIWNPRTQLLINWYTACKTYSKMTHNVTLATWKLIPCPNLPVVWYFACCLCSELGPTRIKKYVFLCINCTRAGIWCSRAQNFQGFLD